MIEKKFSIHDVIASNGMKFLNRMKIYGFSFHCFKINSLELNKILEKLSDVDFAIEIWDVEKRDRQHLIFQETVRHFHNTVASAKSLVEHTRLFVDEYYLKNEKILSSYNQKVLYFFRIMVMPQ